MKIAINKTHWPVKVLGYGNRVGIWLQGCSIGCKGCCSTDTWESHPDKFIELDDLIAWINGLPVSSIDGFTISGGEPFDQSKALELLLKSIRQQYCGDAKRDIIVYSGYRFKKLQLQYPNILDNCDVVISEPYVHNREPSFLRGSNNQGFHLLTDIGRNRYVDSSFLDRQNSIQTEFDGESLWLIGIPNHGDLKRARMTLQVKGITLNSVSWLS